MIEIPNVQTNALEALSPSPILFAPMVGLSHYAVRRALQKRLPKDCRALWPTEMLSSRRLPSQTMGQVPEVNLSDADEGLCPQLLGNEEAFIRPSVEKLEAWGAAALDINMGCPVKRALQHNYGVALMGDPEYAAGVTAMTVRTARVPVSVKLRAGLQNDFSFLLKFAKGIEGAGASWLTLHPRLAAQKRRGQADWSQVRELKKSLSIPVVGNGDLQTLEDVKRAFSETGCDRVMIGRALLAKPWLMEAAWSWWRGRGEPSLVRDPEEQAAQYGNFLKDVLSEMQLAYSSDQTLRKFKFLVYHSHMWLEFGHQLYRLITNSQSVEEFSSHLDSFFSRKRRMFEETNLRR